MYSAYSVIEFAGIADVVKDPDGNARKKVELAGMAKGLEYQSELAFS
jgi:hypothetical protein